MADYKNVNLGKEDLKRMLFDIHRDTVKDLDFRFSPDGTDVHCSVTFNRKHPMELDKNGLKNQICIYFLEKSCSIYNDDIEISPEGCTAKYKDVRVSSFEREMQMKDYTSLTDKRRDQCYLELLSMPERDMVRAIGEHFETHSVMPGEKALKEDVTNTLFNWDMAQRMCPMPDPAYPSIVWPEGKKEAMARQFADTRIREFAVTLPGTNPKDLDLSVAGEFKQGETNTTVYQSRTDAVLFRDEPGKICARVQTLDDSHIDIPIPDKYYANNPLRVDSCKAELLATDWSNGKMKNVSYRIIADTDLMAGCSIVTKMEKARDRQNALDADAFAKALAGISEDGPKMEQ